MPLCSIIIPVFNKWTLTAACLQSIAKHTPADLFEVLLVDNGSSDETPQVGPTFGKKLFGERFTYIRRETETHFAAGCNHGAREATGEYVFFLNNDTLVTAGWLPPLFEPFNEFSNVGATGPVLTYGEEAWGIRVQHLGISYDQEVLPTHLYQYFPYDHSVVQKQREFQSLTGAALLIPRVLFVDTGMFCEEYINGYEDVELTALLSVNGYKLFSVPQSCFYHLEGQSSGRGDHEAQNSQLFLNRVQKHVYSDMHTHFNADGYGMRLSDLGYVEPVVSEEREKELLARYAKEPTVFFARQLVHEEPVWTKGYELLVSQALREKELSLAIHYALLQTYLLCSKSSLELLAGVAKSVHDDDLFANAQSLLASQSNLEKHVQRVATYAKLRAEYREAGKLELSEVFDVWLKQYGRRAS